MLYMVIEHFRNNDPTSVGERFREKGRLMPQGVTYHASWLEPSGARCFQIMETNDLSLLIQWKNNWSDLVDIEIIPVVTSPEFWSARSQNTGA